MQPLAPFIRVVTGHDAHGHAVIASNGPTTNNFPIKAVPGAVFYEVWNSTALLDCGPDPTNKPLQLSPAPLGSMIRGVDIPPDSVQNQISDADTAVAFVEFGEAEASTGHGKHKMMHCTETLDYGIVTEGELWLVLDDGEVQLKRGDVVVQRGTNHAWSNCTEEMARIVLSSLTGVLRLNCASF